MNLATLMAEAGRSALAQRVASLLVALICGAVVAGAVMTTGRTASAEAAVLAEFQTAAARVIVIRDATGAAVLAPPVADVLAESDLVGSILGLTTPVDVVNGSLGPGATKVPQWYATGDLRASVRLVSGRWPRPGEGLAGDAAARALGFDGPAGWVSTDSEIPVVGVLHAEAPFAALNHGVVVPDPRRAPTQLILEAREARGVPLLLTLALSTIATPRAEDLRIDAPTDLARIRGGVAAELGAYRRSLLLGLLSAGAALTALVVLADTLVRRRDLGRRRALGATRSTLVALVVARTAYAACAGAAIGSAAGLLLTRDVDVSPRFAVAVSVLTVLAALVSALAPAIASATRDPVLVLRTP